MFDTDEANNRALVGVSTEEARKHVLARIEALHLPTGAVGVVPFGPVEQLTSLRDAVRPVVGGLGIEFVGADNQYHQCTLGVNVGYSFPPQGIYATAGFYTAGHCGPHQGQNNQVNYTQEGNRNVVVAQERWNPPLSTYPSNGCIYPQLNTYCRQSDVLFASYSTADTTPGAIAQTTYPGIGAFNIGSWQLAGANYTITTTAIPLMGYQVEKMGRTSGWTEGWANNTCSDLVTWDYVDGRWVYILCSEVVTGWGDRGDSGAPAFELLGNGNVAFSGIVWGADFNRGWFFFSNVNQIATEMGSAVNYLSH